MRWRAVGLIGRIFLLCITAGSTPIPFALSQTGDESGFSLEYQVKSTFLYKFISFIEWPKDAWNAPDEPIKIGVIGEGPMQGAVKWIEGKSAVGRKIEVRNFQGIESLEFCHLLFISGSEAHRLKEILKRLEGSGALTVGEAEGFARQGGMIGFIIVENKVRFEINVDSAKKSGLKISSKLLSLAKIVK